MNIKDCPKMLSVRALDGMKLLISFENGAKKQLDVNPYMKRFQPFKELSDRKVFENVVIDKSGFGIIWNDRVDISGCDAWELGIPMQNDDEIQDRIAL
jgi:hypothetical protein